MPRDPARLNRRRFTATAGLAVMTPWNNISIALTESKRPAPSDRLRVGMVGLGSRGFNLLDDLLKLNDVDLVVVCDVDRLHYRDNVWGKGQAFGREAAQTYIEKKGRPRPESVVYFREVCEREDLDAVVVATPDHWHALCTLTALRNGKDVYCEKPVTHWFSEGLQVCREVAERKAVFQTGSQQRSDAEFRRAVELARNGVLGKIERVEVGLPAGYDKAQGDTTVRIPPESLDYDLWCGPAPMMPVSKGHMRNFIDCVRSRETCVASAEIGHRSITPGHLGYVSQAVGRPLRWDALKQVIVSDDEASRLLLGGEYRKPWSVG